MLRCADAATSNLSHPLRSVEAPSRHIASNVALRHVASSRPRPAISSASPALHTSDSHLCIGA
eukprot:3861772-Prymnesium_polylepis.1